MCVCLCVKEEAMAKEIRQKQNILIIQHVLFHLLCVGFIQHFFLLLYFYSISVFLNKNIRGISFIFWLMIPAGDVSNFVFLHNFKTYCILPDVSIYFHHKETFNFYFHFGTDFFILFLHDESIQITGMCENQFYFRTYKCVNMKMKDSQFYYP